MVHAASTLTPPPRGRVRRLHRTPTHPCWHNVVFAERRPRSSETSLVISEDVCTCIRAAGAARVHRYCIDSVESYLGGVPRWPPRQSGSGHRRPRRPRRKSHSVSKCTPIHIEQITDAQRLAARPSWRVTARHVSRSGQNVTFWATLSCTNPQVLQVHHMFCAAAARAVRPLRAAAPWLDAAREAPSNHIGGDAWGRRSTRTTCR